MMTTPMTFMGYTPFYDPETTYVYWTDVMSGTIYRLDTTTFKTYTAKILGETWISFIFPVDGMPNQFIVGAGKRLLLITWDGIHTMAHIVRILTELPMDTVRFHSATTDTRGRLFITTTMFEETGTVYDTTKKLGSLYRFTMDEGLVEMKTKLGMPTGLTFNERMTTFYLVDSYDMMIKQFMYDVKTGTMTSEKLMTDITTYCTPKTVLPFYLTTDTEGFMYVTLYGGSKILKINTTTGKVVTEMMMPVPTVTGMTWGGKMMDTWFMTTASMDPTYWTTGTTWTTMPTMTTGTGTKTTMDTMTTTTTTYPAGYLFKLTGMGTTGTTMTKFTTTH